MYSKIHNPSEYVGGNSGSCLDLVQYLGKENDGKDLLEREMFFDQNMHSITDHKAVMGIDTNVKGLKSDDSKFYMLTVNPSQSELKHIAKLATDGRDISNISQMSPDELKRYNGMIKDYTNNLMHDYASCFNRDISRDDLVYFAKLEQERSFKGYEREVKDLGLFKSGDIKPGLQTHVHVIVSRNDKTQTKKLSPLAKSRGKSANHQLNGKSVRVGFDRNEFKEKSEKLFDRTFGYERKDYEKFKIMKDKRLVPLKMHPAIKALERAKKIAGSVLSPGLDI